MTPYQSKDELRQALYAEAPWDLGSLEDDQYRDAIDNVLDKKKLWTI